MVSETGQKPEGAELRSPGAVLLVSCYELGHQPLGTASPLGFLTSAGFAPDALDISVEAFDPAKVRRARFVGISVYMHTALRLGVRVAQRVRELNPQCHLCFYGLYAALNAEYLLEHGADSCIGGEFEGPLVALVESLDSGLDQPVPGVRRRGEESAPNLRRLPFVPPRRDLLPPLESYAKLEADGEQRVVGYVEASRGCLHLCTHCPIPPVYGGKFVAIPEAVILEDLRYQVAAGATHITFGDPDFLNGPTHALRVARGLHREFPQLTFDFTVKVEHLLKHRALLAEFKELGCLFVVSAVESLSDTVLGILEKGHTREDVSEALRVADEAGITLRPTWVSFTPWTTSNDYRDFLEFVAAHDLVDSIDPVQYSIRLLIPPGSYLLRRPELEAHLGELDQEAFTYRWTHPDPAMDELQRDVSLLVEEAAGDQEDPAVTFQRILARAFGRAVEPIAADTGRVRPPRLTEPWFC